MCYTRALYQRRFEKQPITPHWTHAISFALYQRRFEKQPITHLGQLFFKCLLYQR